MIRLNGEGMTLVLATHDMDIAAELAEKITALEGGRVVLSGRTGEVFQNIEALRRIGLEAPSTVLLMERLNKRE